MGASKSGEADPLYRPWSNEFEQWPPEPPRCAMYEDNREWRCHEVAILPRSQPQWCDDHEFMDVTSNSPSARQRRKVDALLAKRQRPPRVVGWWDEDLRP